MYDQPIRGRGDRIALTESSREGAGYAYGPGGNGMSDRVYQTDYMRTQLPGDKGSPTGGGSSLLTNNVTTQEVSQIKIHGNCFSENWRGQSLF